jgi:oligopeptide/dipeptide ABC transporter ATP-binding protein
MYAGEIVELADTRTIYRSPMHPYTMGLMRCLPDVDAPKGTRTLHPIEGRVPSPANLPVGCIFSPRCNLAVPECSLRHPELVELATGHQVRCLRSLEWNWPRNPALTGLIPTRVLY